MAKGRLTPAPVTTVNEAPSFSADVFGTRPEFDIDPIELLPAGGPADRLRLVRQRTADAFSLTVPSLEVQDLNAERLLTEGRLARLQAHPSEGGFGLPETDNRVVTAKKNLAKLTDDLSRLKQRSEQRAAAWQVCSRVLSSVEEWLKTGRPANCTLEAVETELPKPARGENALLDQIENRRRRVRELRADLHRVESSCLPSNDAKAMVRAEIEALATRGAVDVTPVIEHGGKIAWPMITVRSTVYGQSAGTVAFAEVPDMLGILAWFIRDHVIKVLDGEADAEGDDANALSAEEREQRSAVLLGDIVDIERQEAELVFAAQAQGISVEHRGDVSPLALLGLKLITRPHRGAAQTNGATPTSPQHQMISFTGLPG
jgi:hypothetical protein